MLEKERLQFNLPLVRATTFEEEQRAIPFGRVLNYEGDSNCYTMPVNGDAAISADKLSGIEEESDVYEGFAPHVDRAQITLLTDSPPGKY